MKVVYNHLQVQAAKGRWIPAVGIFFDENEGPDACSLLLFPSLSTASSSESWLGGGKRGKESERRVLGLLKH